MRVMRSDPSGGIQANPLKRNALILDSWREIKISESRRGAGMSANSNGLTRVAAEAH